MKDMNKEVAAKNTILKEHEKKNDKISTNWISCYGLLEYE